MLFDLSDDSLSVCAEDARYARLGKKVVDASVFLCRVGDADVMVLPERLDAGISFLATDADPQSGGVRLFREIPRVQDGEFALAVSTAGVEEDDDRRLPDEILCRECPAIIHGDGERWQTVTYVQDIDVLG